MITKRIVYLFVSLLLILGCNIFLFSQKDSSSEAKPIKPFFETQSYRVTVDSVIKKANNYTVTLIFENLLDRPIEVLWLKKGWSSSDEGPYLLDEKENKYFVQGEDTENIIGEVFGRRAEVLPKTKLKTRLLFYGSGNGQIFSLKASEYISFNRTTPILINRLKVSESENSREIAQKSAVFITESYQVFIESVKKANEDLVLTLIFENLLDNPIQINWGSGNIGWNGIWENSAEPYLIDENAERFYLRKSDSGKVIGSQGFYSGEILPNTQLKTQITFKDVGNSKVFTFGCKENRPKQDRPIVIQNIKIQDESQ